MSSGAGPSVSQDNVLVVPAIPIEVAVKALRAVDDGLDELLEYAWATDEAEVATRIEEGINAAAGFIHKVANDLPEDDAAKEEYAKRYLEAVAREPERENGQIIQLYPGFEGDNDKEVTQADVIEGLAFVKTLFKELAEELLRFSKQDVEEVADLALNVSRMWLEICRGMTQKTLRLLEKDYAAEEQIREDHDGPRFEEPTDSEIEEFYRARGEEPPPRSQAYREEQQQRLSPKPSSSTKRRRKRAPARLLWHPLAPALREMVKNLPSQASSHPFKTCGTAMVLLPFSGLVIFLPGVLLTDHVLQKIYSAYGSQVEVVVDDGLQVARLGFVMARLSVRQTYRVVKRQLVKVGADPKAAAGAVISSVFDAATHPVRTVSLAYEVAADTVKGVYGWVSWAMDSVKQARG